MDLHRRAVGVENFDRQTRAVEVAASQCMFVFRVSNRRIIRRNDRGNETL